MQDPDYLESMKGHKNKNYAYPPRENVLSIYKLDE